MLRVHELALTESLVQEILERVPNRRVLHVRLEIGRLMAVLPDAMRFSFEVCTRGTPLEGASLEVIEIAAVATCRACGGGVTAEDGLLLCPCGSADLDVIRGRELRIRDVEVI
jgi:hydrogenase nickel incorporation protein HypA/HybF